MRQHYEWYNILKTNNLSFTGYFFCQRFPALLLPIFIIQWRAATPVTWSNWLAFNRCHQIFLRCTVLQVRVNKNWHSFCHALHHSVENQQANLTGCTSETNSVTSQQRAKNKVFSAIIQKTLKYHSISPCNFTFMSLTSWQQSNACTFPPCCLCHLAYHAPES